MNFNFFDARIVRWLVEKSYIPCLHMAAETVLILWLHYYKLELGHKYIGDFVLCG